ncbi:hypothetical protein D1007_35553 [Hordeum vulgare]|nr:hypothetical protein D1007_35553 [Hordeum vulgare]
MADLWSDDDGCVDGGGGRPCLGQRWLQARRLAGHWQRRAAAGLVQVEATGYDAAVHHMLEINGGVEGLVDFSAASDQIYSGRCSWQWRSSHLSKVIDRLSLHLAIRLYYRCSYREDKQCLASKLVQQENHEDPPLFKVTYTYEHTCNSAPVPTPDVVAELPAPATGDALFLRFDSTGAGHRDAHRIEQERHYQQPAAPGSGWPSMMLSFDSNSQQHEQCTFPSELPPAASSSFSTEGLPAPPSTTDGGGDGFSTWDSLRYGLNDHVHFGDHPYLPNSGNDGDDNY